MIKTKRALPILFAVMFLVMVGFGIIIPVLPFYAENIGATPIQLGFLMAVYSLTQLLFAPIWGRISDRIGRKPVIIIGILGLSLSFYLMAISTSLWMLFVARIIGGILSSANMPTVMAYVADITSPEDRGKGMGVVGAATGLGFVFGPSIGWGLFKNKFKYAFLCGWSNLPSYLLPSFVFVKGIFNKREKRSKPQRANISMERIERVTIDSVLSSIVYLLVLIRLRSNFCLFCCEESRDRNRRAWLYFYDHGTCVSGCSRWITWKDDEKVW